MPTVHFNALVAVTFVGLAGMTGSATAQFSSQFDLDGDVATPGVYSYASLSAAALPHLPTTLVSGSDRGPCAVGGGGADSAA